jgi:glycosyltransferase involved in cell wall biosynthesis
VAIKEITDRIQSEEIDFSMVTLRYDSSLPKYEKIGNIKIHRIGFSVKNPKPESLVKFPLYLNKVFYPILATLKAFSLDKKEKFDGFWSMMIFMSMPAMFFNFLFKRKSYLISIQEGDDLKGFMRKWFMRPFKNVVIKALHQATYVQTISEYLADWIRSMGYAGKLIVIPNGVDLNKFSKNDMSTLQASVLRKNLGINEKDFLVVSISRLVYKNGMDVLIDSFKSLEDNFKLVIVGDGPLKKDLLERIEKNNFKNKVFLVGQKTQDEIPFYLNMADAFCRPSRTEGQGIAFLEAMAYKVPILATEVGGIKEFLVDKKTGFVVRSDDSIDLADKIRFVEKEVIIREKVKKEAYKLIKIKYDWEELVLNMKKDFFSKVLRN